MTLSPNVTKIKAILEQMEDDAIKEYEQGHSDQHAVLERIASIRRCLSVIGAREKEPK